VAEQNMLMTNENIRLLLHDRIFERTILKLVPRWIHPNHVTILRLLLTPAVLYFLWRENWAVALPLFIFAALTDAFDGSLARTRKQITMWGTVADPIADKLLVGSVVVLFVAQEVNILFAVFIILMELLIILGALIRKWRHGTIISANEFGKLKMVLQVTGVGILLLAKLLGFRLAVPFAIGTFSLAIVFAIVSFFTYGL